VSCEPQTVWLTVNAMRTSN